MIRYNRYNDPSFVRAYYDRDRNITDKNGRTSSLVEWLQPYGVLTIHVCSDSNDNIVEFNHLEDELIFRLKWPI
jgi:hypothetical protein